MSEAVPKSIADAAARFRMPPMPSSMSSVFQPASAIYSNASPASVAEYFVSRPHCLADSVSLSVSSAVAPLIACTFDICCSKFAATVTDAAATPPIAVVTFIMCCPAVCTACPTFPAFSAYSSNFWRASSALTSRSCTSMFARSASACVTAAPCFFTAASYFVVCASVVASCFSALSSSVFNFFVSSEFSPVASLLSSYAFDSSATFAFSSSLFFLLLSSLVVSVS